MLNADKITDKSLAPHVNSVPAQIAGNLSGVHLQDNRPKSVVQQKQLQATMQMKSIGVSDDAVFEHEATMMGAKASENYSPILKPVQFYASNLPANNYASGKTVQRMEINYPGGSLDTDTVLTSTLGELSSQELMAIITVIEHNPMLNDRKEVRAKHVLRVAKTEFLKKNPHKHGLPALGLPTGGWGAPAAALGDAYLNANAARRPKIVNRHDVRSDEGKKNCSLVAAAAVLGKTSKDLYAELQPESANGGGEYVSTSLAFLGHDAKKYNSSGGIKDEVFDKMHGTLKEYKKKRAEETGEPEQNFVMKWINMKAAAGMPNAQIQKDMENFVKKELGWGVRIRTGGSPSSMLAVQEGIVSMKKSPPGTQYIVFVQGAEGTPVAPHYVYANNLGGNIHFHDYQPFGIGSEEAHGDPAHPHSVDQPTPTPFNGAGAFTELSFIAFEVNAGHIIEYLMRLYRN